MFIRIRTVLTFKIIFTLVVVLSIACLSYAKGHVAIKDVRFSVSGPKARIVIEFNHLPLFKADSLTRPDRIYLDFKDANTRRPVETIKINKGMLRKIRIAQYNRNTVRFVIHLQRLKDYKVFVLNNPPRLVIDIGSDKGSLYGRRKVVVIDPGHGGHDPGAIGPGGLKEKDVALDISRRLKRILEERYNLEVHLTRNRDVFLDLGRRTRIANRKGADIFVSVHTNASPHRRARGIETYLLNWTNDAQALRVAARENSVSFERMKRSQSELGRILASLQRDDKRDKSLKLAHFIQSSLIKKTSESYSRIKNLGVKQALFYVLVDAEMPSVLVEVCFISNPKEERLLRSRRFRKTTAEAIAAGIYRYVLSLPDAPMLAMEKVNLPKL
jgi:N-acetylmuramoyl-L-alanine amidase